MDLNKKIYILFVQSQKAKQVLNLLKKNDIQAFIPCMEKYIHSLSKIVDDIVMLPGYIFIESNLSQDDFSSKLQSIKSQSSYSGMIKELKFGSISTLTKEEQQLHALLFDDNGIIRISYGYKNNGITTV